MRCQTALCVLEVDLDICRRGSRGANRELAARVDEYAPRDDARAVEDARNARYYELITRKCSAKRDSDRR